MAMLAGSAAQLKAKLQSKSRYLPTAAESRKFCRLERPAWTTCRRCVSLRRAIQGSRLSNTCKPFGRWRVFSAAFITRKLRSLSTTRT